MSQKLGCVEEVTGNSNSLNMPLVLQKISELREASTYIRFFSFRLRHGISSI